MQPGKGGGWGMDTLGEAVTSVGVGSGIVKGGICNHEPRVHVGPIERPITIVGDLVVAAFGDCTKADRALDDLRHSGQPADRLGRAGTNGVLIEQAGELAHADVAGRGLFAALEDMGVPEAEALHCARQFDAYCSLVTVRVNGPVDRLVARLERYQLPRSERPADRPVSHDARPKGITSRRAGAKR